MKFTRKDKEILCAFGCSNLDATVKRLRAAAALAPDFEIKKTVVDCRYQTACKRDKYLVSAIFSQLCQDMENASEDTEVGNADER